MKWVVPFIDVVLFALSVIWWTVVFWVLLSWIVFFASQSSFRWRNRGLYNVLTQINDLLSRMAYPFVRPFRRISPMLLLLVIYLIRRLLWLILASIVVP